MKQKFLLCFLGVFLITLGACSPSKEQPKEQAKESAKVSAYKPDISFADAIKQSDEKAVKYYLEQDETPNQLDDDGNPFLVLAAAQDNMKIFQDLLTAKAFMDTKNTKGENALWTAVNNGNYDIAQLLIILGADVNTANQDNMTPLMAASQNGYILNVEQLLQNRADISVKNNQDKTALDLAKEQLQKQKSDDEDFQTYSEIVNMLKEAGQPVIPAAVKAIATSNIDSFNRIAAQIKTLPQEKQARLLYMASGVCVPNITQICHRNNMTGKNEYPCITKGLVCDKENNAQIIRTLIENGAHTDGFVYVDQNYSEQPLDISTISYNLQKANPELLMELMPKLDTCMLALTQISHPNPNEADDGLYAAYWLKENCSLSKMNFLGVEFYEKKNRPEVDILSLKDLWYTEEYTLSKDELIKKLGEPNFIEQKNASTEILTYRKYVGAVVNFKDVDIVDTNYTLKHGIVVKKEEKVVARKLRPYVDRDKIAVYETKRGY